MSWLTWSFSDWMHWKYWLMAACSAVSGHPSLSRKVIPPRYFTWPTTLSPTYYTSSKQPFRALSAGLLISLVISMSRAALQRKSDLCMPQKETARWVGATLQRKSDLCIPRKETARWVGLHCKENPIHVFFEKKLPVSRAALQRYLKLWIPRKGIARPQSKFPHSCICEIFIFILTIGPPIFLQQTERGNV